MTSPLSALHFPTGMAALLLVAGPVAAAGSPASFDGIYTGSVAVTSVRAVPIPRHSRGLRRNWLCV